MKGALRSLLVTDIVGSTRLWAENESAMAVDLVSHDEMVSAAIVSAGGRVFKHTGDGAMATFESATASAEAAAEIQRAIGGHVWRVPDGIRVRVALHSGSVHERDGDLFGPPVNRLARLLSRCSPGAVIVSEATASLLADGIPDVTVMFADTSGVAPAIAHLVSFGGALDVIRGGGLIGLEPNLALRQPLSLS